MCCIHLYFSKKLLIKKNQIRNDVKSFAVLSSDVVSNNDLVLL